jgi:hypothetical protein
LRGHALNTSTDTNIDHTRPDTVGNIGDGLETTRALTVQTLDGSGLGEASHESSGTELSGTTTGRQNGTNSDILNGLGIETTLVKDSLEDTSEQISGSGIFEATLATLREGRSQSTCHDNIIGVLFGEGGGSLLAEVGGNLIQALLSYKSRLVYLYFWTITRNGQQNPILACTCIHTGRHDVNVGWGR